MDQRSFYYFLIQLAGYLLQIFPVVILLYAAFSDEQLKVSKKKLVPLFLAGVFVLSLLAAGGLTCFYDTDLYRQGTVRWIANGFFSVIWIAGTAVYICSFKKGVKCRALCYFITVQYGISAYTVAEIVGRMTEYGDLVPYATPAVAAYLLSMAVIFPIVYRLLKKYGALRLRGENHRLIRFASFSSIALLALYGAALLAEVNLLQDAQDLATKLHLSVWLVCMLATDLVAYYMYFYSLHIEEEKETLHVQLAAFELQSQSMMDKIQEERRTQHNLRHHFRTLISLAENHQYGRLEEYLKTYLNDWENHRLRVISQNPVLNNILGYYISQAEQEKVKVLTDIRILTQYPFDILDMTVLLGNAMENALEACRRCEAEPWIRVDIRHRQQAVLIKIENSCADDGGQGGLLQEPLRSSKSGRVSGYGLRSMEMIARKYQGSLEYWKKDGVFTLRAVLNIPGNRERGISPEPIDNPDSKGGRE